MHDILISVLIPAYNASHFIRKCLDSIINSYEKAGRGQNDIEIICVDDGSKDNTWDILQKYAENYSYIRVIHKENGGVGSARNEALKHAQGKYIGWVDADDFVTDDWYGYVAEGLRIHQPDCLLIDYFVKEDEKIIHQNINLGEIVTKQQFIYEQSLEHELKNFLWILFIKADFWRNIRFPNLHILEDMTVITELIPKCESIYHIKQSLYFYVMNDSSLTHNVSPDVMWSNIQVVKSRYDKYDKMGYTSYSLNDILMQLLGYWYHPNLSSDKNRNWRKQHISNLVKLCRAEFMRDPGISKKSKIKMNCIYFHLDNLLKIALYVKRRLKI